MKLLYLLPLFFISTLAAQNWNPVNLHDIYNFKSDSTGLITHSIWVDSVKVEGGDSVFYLNRVVRECDTCVNISSSCSRYFFLKNQPQFLQRKIRNIGFGNYQLEDPDSLLIKSFARLNDTWVYDSKNQVLATVTSLRISSFLGILDSVKIISLSNGKNLVLSKNHGGLFYPNDSTNPMYQLVGIEGNRAIGERTPNALDFFDFEVGDEFHFKQLNFSFGLSCGSIRAIMDRVLNKEKKGDTVKYIIESYVRYFESKWADHIYINFPNTLSLSSFYPAQSSLDTVTYTKYENSRPNGHPGQLVSSNYLWSIGLNEFLVTPSMSRDKNGKLTKEFGKTFPPLVIPDSIPNCSSPHPDILVHISGYLHREWYKYQSGLGSIYTELGFFEGVEKKELIGYKKNGIPTGFLFDRDDFISSNHPLENSHLSIRVFPNPSSGILYLTFDNHNQGALSLKVYAMTGELVYSDHQIPDGSEIEIDLKGNSSGVYLIRVEQGGKSHSQRIVLDK